MGGVQVTQDRRLASFPHWVEFDDIDWVGLMNRSFAKHGFVAVRKSSMAAKWIYRPRSDNVAGTVRGAYR